MTKVSYSAVHSWLRRKYGAASKCENPECKHKGPRRYEWALRKGYEYQKKVENFIQFCPSCHRKYDFTETQRQQLKRFRNTGKKPPYKEIIQRDKMGNLIKIFYSTLTASIETGTNRQSIHNVLCGRAMHANGFQWGAKF